MSIFLGSKNGLCLVYFWVFQKYTLSDLRHLPIGSPPEVLANGFRGDILNVSFFRFLRCFTGCDFSPIYIFASHKLLVSCLKLKNWIVDT